MLTTCLDISKSISLFTGDASISASDIRRRINVLLVSVVLTKGTDDEYAVEFAYVACAYACVASENQAIRFYGN